MKEDYYECIDKVDTQCRKLVHQMREELGDDRLRISFDEWNVWYGWYRAKSVNDGIFTASMLHMLIEEAGTVRNQIWRAILKLLMKGQSVWSGSTPSLHRAVKCFLL